MRLLAVLYGNLLGSVSIHASVKDATNALAVRAIMETGFNPRICKRCDFVKAASSDNAISFNPRICKRCDSMFVKNFIDDTFKL